MINFRKWYQLMDRLYGAAPLSNMEDRDQSENILLLASELLIGFLQHWLLLPIRLPSFQAPPISRFLQSTEPSCLSRYEIAWSESLFSGSPSRSRSGWG
jgi:hypothetical protein